jgi:hypothetical protein
MSEVVRAKRGHAGGGAGSGDCGAEAIAAEALEDSSLGDAIVAWHERGNGQEELRILENRGRRPGRRNGWLGDEAA